MSSEVNMSSTAAYLSSHIDLPFDHKWSQPGTSSIRTYILCNIIDSSGTVLMVNQGKMCSPEAGLHAAYMESLVKGCLSSLSFLTKW